jgi:hypothetical protein
LEEAQGIRERRRKIQEQLYILQLEEGRCMQVHNDVKGKKRLFLDPMSGEDQIEFAHRAGCVTDNKRSRTDSRLL